MKTLSDLIREIFAVRNEERKRRQSPKQETHETENHEVDGNPGMAHPDSEETDRAAEIAWQPESGGESGGNPTEEPEPEPESESESEPRITPEELQAAVEKAYREGEIAGRNAVIEEKHFPADNDGIPQFRGRQTKNTSSTDIFSMAREA